MKRPAYGLRTTPIGPDQVEIAVACKHGRHRVGWRLGETVTHRRAVAATIAMHAINEGCTCVADAWARYCTPDAPADLAGVVTRFGALWTDVEAQQRRHGYAVIDLAAACAQVMGGRG